MKNHILTFFFLLLAFGCSQDDSDTTFQLPPETQIGANTFGVTIKGKVYIPRDPTGVSVGTTAKGMIFWRSPDDLHSFDELEIKDGASAVGFNMKIHIQNLYNTGAGQYVLKQSNFHNSIDSTPYPHIYFKIWDSTINNYAYYGSLENQGVINIMRYDFLNRIVSGKFSGKFFRYDNQNDTIEITDGRFDINWNTLTDTPFH